MRQPRDYACGELASYSFALVIRKDVDGVEFSVATGFAGAFRASHGEPNDLAAVILGDQGKGLGLGV